MTGFHPVMTENHLVSPRAFFGGQVANDNGAAEHASDPSAGRWFVVCQG